MLPDLSQGRIVICFGGCAADQLQIGSSPPPFLVAGGDDIDGFVRISVGLLLSISTCR